MEAVRGGRTEKSFEEQLDELLAYFAPAEDARVKAIPAIGNAPPVCLLGSSAASARIASARGLPYAFAHHLDPSAAAEAARVRTPMLVSVSAIVADTDERAEWLAGSTRLKVLSRLRGNRIRLPSPEDAAARPCADDDRAEIAARSGSVLVGSPETVTRKLQAVLDETGVGELMITTPVFHHADRRRSHELLAERVRDALRHRAA